MAVKVQKGRKIVLDKEAGATPSQHAIGGNGNGRTVDALPPQIQPFL